MQELGFTPSHGIAHVFGSALYQLSEGKALPCAFAAPHDRVCIAIVLGVCGSVSSDLVTASSGLENCLRSHQLRTETIRLPTTVQS